MLNNDRGIQFLKESSCQHTNELTRLINQAYRGKEGAGRWTTEHHLIDGQRIQEEQLNDIISAPNTALYSAWIEQNLVGCIYLKPINSVTMEFGTFAVTPELHGSGIGSFILQHAESQTGKQFTHFQVSVVSLNQKLIAFYQRRGYTATGSLLPYPIDAGVGTPLQKNTHLTVLRKNRF